jgi:hypothetical protein
MSIRNIITLFWVKLKALSMEEKYVDILWDVVHDIF